MAVKLSHDLSLSLLQQRGVVLECFIDLVLSLKYFSKITLLAFLTKKWINIFIFIYLFKYESAFIFWFDLFLEARAEIFKKKFGWFFGRNDDTQKTFRN